MQGHFAARTSTYGAAQATLTPSEKTLSAFIESMRPAMPLEPSVSGPGAAGRRSLPRLGSRIGSQVEGSSSSTNFELAEWMDLPNSSREGSLVGASLLGSGKMSTRSMGSGRPTSPVEPPLLSSVQAQLLDHPTLQYPFLATHTVLTPSIFAQQQLPVPSELPTNTRTRSASSHPPVTCPVRRSIAGSQPVADDEPVPEAALQGLLRLGLPSQSVGSARTSLSHDEDSRSDTGMESDATSVHSDVEKDRPNSQSWGLQLAHTMHRPEWNGDLVRMSDVLPRFEPSFPSTSYYHSTTGQQAWSYTHSRAGSESSVGTNASTPRVRRHRPARSIGSEQGRQPSHRASVKALPVAPGPAGRTRQALGAMRSAKVIKVEPVSDVEVSSSDEDDILDVKPSATPELEPLARRRRFTRSASIRREPAHWDVPSKRMGTSPITPDSDPDAGSESDSKDTLPSRIKQQPPRQPRRLVVQAASIGNRTFAPTTEIAPGFPRLYRSFHVPSAISPNSPLHARMGILATTTTVIPRRSGRSGPADPSNAPAFAPVPLPTGATWSAKAADPLNLYLPRFTKGTGEAKEAACPICIEPVSRGGTGEVLWHKVSFLVSPELANALSPAQEQQLRLPHVVCARDLQHDWPPLLAVHQE